MANMFNTVMFREGQEDEVPKMDLRTGKAFTPEQMEEMGEYNPYFKAEYDEIVNSDMPGLEKAAALNSLRQKYRVKTPAQVTENPAPVDNGGLMSKLVSLTPQYVRDHPWAVGLGTVATVGALIAAYALWKKKKGESTAAVEEMCVLYPLLNKYSKSLSESYSFDNYNSYINASKRMDKIAPVVYDMMLREGDEDEVGPINPFSGNPYTVDQKEALGMYNPAYASERDAILNSDMPGLEKNAALNTLRQKYRVKAPYEVAEESPYNTENPDAGIISEILAWFKATGNKAVEAFLNSYNVTADWVKAHPGMAGAAALAAILGTYGVYKLIKLYKESKENGEVDAKELEESIDMLRKFKAVCESSCNPYITETQKYKNITLLCNLIDSDL